MKTIYLDQWHTSPLIISDEGFAHISSLISQYLVCGTCEQAYSQQNPQVGQNICLSCLVMRQHDLTYVGPGEPDEAGRAIFIFLDKEGYVYSSIAGASEKAVKDVYRTMVHWGFPVPTTYTTAQGEIPLHRSDWRLHGDLWEASVIVAEYEGHRPSLAFLLYKEGTYKELSKRDSETKWLLQRARETINATRGQDGRYHVGAYPTYTIFDSQVYAVVSAMESAVYEVQHRIRSKKPADVQETDHQEIQAS
jgi:hypothetical protein